MTSPCKIMYLLSRCGTVPFNMSLLTTSSAQTPTNTNDVSAAEEPPPIPQLPPDNHDVHVGAHNTALAIMKVVDNRVYREGGNRQEITDGILQRHDYHGDVVDRVKGFAGIQEEEPEPVSVATQSAETKKEEIDSLLAA